MTQVKINETASQDRVITIAAGDNAISVLLAELQNYVIDAIREGRLTPAGNISDSTVISTHPYEMVDGKPNTEDGVHIGLLDNGAFIISINEYYSATSMPVHKAAKKMYDSIQDKRGE